MFRYTALGDSITAGFGATSPCLSYPSRIVEMMRTRSGQSIGEVLAYPGWTSADLDAGVFENSSVYLSNATAITIWVGGDDLIHAAIQMLQARRLTSGSGILKQSLAAYGRDQALLVKAVRRVSHAKLILCTQYNPFPNTPLAGEAVAALNTVTARVAGTAGAGIAPTEAWFAGREAELIAGYRTGRIEDVLRGATPIHPNNLGHAVIAQNLAPMLGR